MAYFGFHCAVSRVGNWVVKDTSNRHFWGLTSFLVTFGPRSQADLTELLAGANADELLAHHLQELHISVDDLGHDNCHLLPPSHLTQAVSNRFTLYCAQVLKVLEALPLPPDPDAAADGISLEEEDSEQENVATGVLAPDASGTKLLQRWRMLQRHCRRAAQRERVEVLQILFAHTVDLKHYSNIMLVRS